MLKEFEQNYRKKNTKEKERRTTKDREKEKPKERERSTDKSERRKRESLSVSEDNEPSVSKLFLLFQQIMHLAKLCS